jgi:ribosomal protein S19E (S16A)
MNFDIQKTPLIELLEFAEETCGCESYYGYRCSKCKKTARGFTQQPEIKKVYEENKPLGYFSFDDYHGLSLTPSGEELLKRIRLEE